MGYFPFFVDIEARTGLIVGGGRIAAHKIEKLLPFMPRLTVVAPWIEPKLKENHMLVCKERSFCDSDVEGMFFVIAATDEEELNAHISRLCRERGILVNVVDDKEKCSFLFPSLVKEGELSVGISTGGASPQMASWLRSEVAAAIPAHTEKILDFLMELRGLAKERIADGHKRAVFLKEAASLCIEQDRVLSREEVEERMTAVSKKGSVTLVGAGCGAYDLITVKGLNAVKSAQVLIYDDLIDERLLSHVSESCEKLYVGKRSGIHSMKQEQINALLIAKAGEGKRVVRLKGGDPFVFGRGGEEMLALKKAGIPVTEIPGITSAIAIPAAAGIPVTHREISRSFHVITGHTAGGEEGLPEDMETIARLQGTCVFLMGLSHLEEIVGGLLLAGKDISTPVAVVHGNFDGTVDALRGTLENIVEIVRQSDIAAPAVIVVGGTAGVNYE